MGFRRIELGLLDAPVKLNGFEDSRRETGIAVRSIVAGCLAWLDCAALGPDNQARERFLDRGHVALEPGLRFGAAGGGYARLNFATSTDILDQATAQMAAAVI